MVVKDFACPSCNAKTLRAVERSLDLEYQGKQLHIEGLEGSECLSCGADPVLMPQIRANQIRIADAKRASTGLLTGAKIKEIRETLGLSQSAAAEAFGGGANAFSKYERGEVIQSAQMDKLLRAAAKHPDLLADFLDCGTTVVLTPMAAPPNHWEVVTTTHGAGIHSYGQGLILNIPSNYPGAQWNYVDCANDEHYAAVVGA